MRFITVKNPGKNYSLAVSEAAAPEPTEYEVLIKVAASGVNRADIFQAQGMYPPPTGASPILGLEVAGEIVKLGDKVKMYKLGDKVCALLPGGGCAEYVTARESEVLPIPAGLNMVQGAALPEVMFTAYLNLFELGHLGPGKSVLIHGGASGVGTIAIQMAQVMGVTVYATAGTKEKCTVCQQLGAKRAIHYKSEDFAEVIKQETGNGVDLVLDMVGGDYVSKNLSALKPGGILVSIAVLQSGKAEINLAALLMKNITIIGSTLRSRSILEKHEIARSLFTSFWPMLENGTIKPIIDSTYPFADAMKAHQRMQQNLNTGKIILTA